MNRGTRRTFAFGAALTLAVTAFAAAPAAAQDEPPMGGKIVFGDWQAASQLNPYMTNTVTNFQAIYPALLAPLDIDNDGQYVTELLALAMGVEGIEKLWPKHMVDPRPLLVSKGLAR